MRSKLNKFEHVKWGGGACTEVGGLKLYWGRSGGGGLVQGLIPTPNRMKDTAENITLPQLRWRAVIITIFY